MTQVLWIKHNLAECGASLQVNQDLWSAGQEIICSDCNVSIGTYVQFTANAENSKTLARQAEVNALALMQQKKEEYAQKLADNIANGVKPPKPKTLSELFNIQPIAEEEE